MERAAERTFPSYNPDSDQNEEGLEFLLTPIFQHRDENSMDKEAEFSQYKRKVIDRIITPVPFNVYDSKNNDRGDIEVCIEEYYHEKGNSLSPLLRRVAVRSYAGLTEERDVGILHASFSLPIGELPRNIISDMLHAKYLDCNDNGNFISGSGSVNTSSNVNFSETSRKEELSSAISNNWICWTKFQSTEGCKRRNNSNKSKKFGNHSRSHLCVLTGPRTLKIFDVYPKQSYNNSDNVDGISQGEGQTISLPFEASSIFALPSPHYGLILQRADNGDEDTAMIQFNDEYYPSDTVRLQNNEENDNITGKDDFIIEGPPSTVRLGLNRNRDFNESSDEGKEDRAMSASPSCSSSDLGLDVQPTTFSQIAPSLYTLHHPLDDILPCNISPCSISGGKGRKMQQSVWRKNDQDMNLPVQHFTNVFENVIFVGKPRCFIPHSPDDSYSANSDEVTIVVTFNTQNKRHAFWTLKSAASPTPKLSLWQQTSPPLNNDNPNNVDIFNNPNEWGNEPKDQNDIMITEKKLEEEEEENMNNNFSPFSELHACVSLNCVYRTSSSSYVKDGSEYIQNMLSPQDKSEIVAREVFLATNASDNGDFVLCMLQAVENQCQKSTMSWDESSSEQNDHKLRCFVFKPQGCRTGNDRNIKEKEWQVVQTSEIDCLAAQPIYSTPINPPSFSPLNDEKGRHNFFADWRTKYTSEPPMAVDICVCKRITEGTKLSLFRQDVHVVDCKIQHSGESLATVLNLLHPVGDRVDVVCKNESNSFFIVRASLSLVIKTSQVTENSLLAVSSSILHEKSHMGNSESLSNLCCSLRADCAILSQLVSSFPESQELTDDVEWFVFSSLLSALFAFALNEASTRDYISSFEADSLIDEESNADGNDAWESLLQSEFHTEYFGINNETMLLSNPDISTGKKCSCLTEKMMHLFLRSSCYDWLSSLTGNDDTRISICSMIFDSLHILYEEMKLSHASGCSTYVRLLGNLLLHLSSRSHLIDEVDNPVDPMSDFVVTYMRDLGIDIPVKQPGFTDVYFVKRVTSFHHPPCFSSLLERIIKGEKKNTIITEWTNDDRIMFNGVCSTIGVLIHFFDIYFDEKWKMSGKTGMVERDRCLIMAITQEGFDCPSKFLEKFPLSITSLLMEVCHRCRSEPPPISNSWSAAAYDLVGRADLSEIQNLLSSGGNVNAISGIQDSSIVTRSLVDDDIDKDGLVCIEKSSAMFFPNDNRVREAARLLRSSRPVFLRVHRSVEVSDHDYERQKQEKLSLLCRRVVSLSLGRGMMTYGTLDPLPAEPLSIPMLCLAGRIPPRNATLALDNSIWTAEMKVWPEFHNGVAAGLRLPVCTEKKAKSMGEIERSWIVYNKPSQSSPENVQNNNNQAQNQPASVYAHGGFLMALGLRGYLSALSMPDVIDYLTKGSETTAVGILLGMSANKRGTCDLSVSKMLCLHIPSLFPTSFSSIDVVSETQTAAVAGIGLLYQKSSHRLMSEFLLNEIGKRPTNEQNINDRESYALCCGIALGMVNLGLRNKQKTSKIGTVDDLSDLRIEERLLRYIIGGLDENYIYQQKGNASNTNNESERCSRIYEGDMINIDITAPGATLALGMIYLQSGNKSVAKQLALPETHFSLDKIRPDFLFLNVVARSLVLWHEVEASSQWIDQQIPMFISEFFSRLQRKLRGDTNIEEYRINVDSKAMKEAHAFIIAGACFSLGLRFAGTGNEKARDAVFEKVVEFQKYRDDSDPFSMLIRPQRPIVEMCTGSAAISLAMIMAGTGDLKILRLLKILRWRCDDGVKYGSHMAINAAIGMLFLGGGTCTLGREPEDIAALLVALFPRFPMSTQDNQYHLQALRHIYSLAVKQRTIEAVDIESKEKIFVPIKLEYSDQSSIESKTPFLLMNRGRLTKIKVNSDRYYPVEVDLNALSLSDQTFHLFVKKRSGSISYVEDPYGFRSNFFQSVASHGEKNFLDLLTFTTEAKDLQIYARYLCGNKRTTKQKFSSYLSSFDAFCTKILRESLLEEKTDSVPLLLALYQAMISIKRIPFPTKTIWDLRLLRSLYEDGSETTGSFKIVSPHLVAILCQHIDKLFYELDQHKLTSMSHDNFVEDSRWVGPYSVWFCKLNKT